MNTCITLRATITLSNEKLTVEVVLTRLRTAEE